MSYTFKVEKREDKLKDDSLCMGVVSSGKMESVPLQFDLREFKKLYAEAGQNSIITLEGLDEPVEVTIQYVDLAPVTSEVHHVEFHALERGVEMEADIPLTLAGEAPAAKQDAVINQVLDTVSITCRPKDLIQEIEVDMTLLKEVGDTIRVKDLTVPSTIKITDDPETVVVNASEPAAEEEPEPAEEVSEPELVDQKNEGGEEEAAEETEE